MGLLRFGRSRHGKQLARQDDTELMLMSSTDNLMQGDTAEDKHLLVRTTRRRPSMRASRLVSLLSCNPRTLLRSVVLILGWYQLLLIALSIVDAFCPDSAISILASFAFDGALDGDILSLSNATQPISCHSHNDYWRVRPLHSAIEVGCASVEADVWLEEDDLLVGHVRSSLSKERTLLSTYLEPIQSILDSHNVGSKGVSKRGIFESEPSRSLILLVDFKNDGLSIWPMLSKQLSSLREENYLTYFNGTDLVEGPLTIVASGDVHFKDIVRDPGYRDIFFDAPLRVMDGNTQADVLDYTTPLDITDEETLPSLQPVNPAVYSPVNSYYASGSFRKIIGYPRGSRLSQAQMALIRAQVRGAHQRGLKVRYWDVPTWPVGVRNYLWRVLVREGVDYLSVDDIKAVVHGDWGPRKGGWNRKWWA